MMMTKSIYLLLIAFSITFTSTAFAQRPAAFDEPATEETLPSTSESMDDGRPAASSTTEPAVETETTTVETRVQQTGDVLSMQAQPAPVRLMDFPRRGMTQDKVQNELGRPVEIVPAVGQPPITRWVYDDRIVFFEYSTVLHVVAK